MIDDVSTYTYKEFKHRCNHAADCVDTNYLSFNGALNRTLWAYLYTAESFFYENYLYPLDENIELQTQYEVTKTPEEKEKLKEKLNYNTTLQTKCIYFMQRYTQDKHGVLHVHYVFSKILDQLLSKDIDPFQVKGMYFKDGGYPDFFALRTLTDYEKFFAETDDTQLETIWKHFYSYGRMFS